MEYIFDIDKSYMNRFFKPIKNKIQIIELMMYSIKYMLLNPVVKQSNVEGKLIIRKDKMSRLFFMKEDKYFSISFPFYIQNDGGVFTFSYKNLMDIDSRLISEIISLLINPSFISNCSLDFADKISSYQEDTYNEFYWDFIRDLLLLEDGYLRYDYDHDNYIKHNKSDIHPLNHYDLFYSSNATFKIGLKNKISDEKFIDLLNIKTDCKYIN